MRPVQRDVGYSQDYMRGGNRLYPLKMPGIVISLERETGRDRQKQTHTQREREREREKGCYEANEGNVSQKPSGVS